MHIFKDTKFDFLRWRVHAIVLSWIVIIAGAFVFATRGIPLGIEFAGGTSVIEKFEQPVSIQQVRQAIDRGFPGGGAEAVINSFGAPGQNQRFRRNQARQASQKHRTSSGPVIRNTAQIADKL